jgi:long-subunit acyl-CoA synthetase (AMP-forming)
LRTGCCTRQGNLLIYGPLRNVLGMSNIRIAYTAGAAIGPDLFRFYRSIGINLKQLYGQTETCAYVCLQPDRGVKFDTVGLPAPGVELKLAAERRSARARAHAAQGVLQATGCDRPSRSMRTVISAPVTPA